MSDQSLALNTARLSTK